MSDRRPTLFYSWQSDHPKTRSYIEDALKKALENIASNMKVEDAPRLDKDTQGEVGAVPIASTIKRKISESTIFVADISLIDQGKKGRKLVNQNVMFELGYAFGKKTEKAVILIANRDLGDTLPFDIAQNRTMFCSPKTDPKAEKFMPTLEYAIRAHLGFIAEERRIDEQADSREKLVDAIENKKPTSIKADKYITSLYQRYLEAAPDRYHGGDTAEYGERVVDAYQKSLPITLELYDVLSIAAECGDVNTVTAAYKSLGLLAAMYDNQPGENSKYKTSNEYYALVIQEIASIIIGLLARFNQWQIIGNLIPHDFTKPKNGREKYSIGNAYYYPESVKHYYQKSGRNAAIPTTSLIQERFVDHDKTLQAYADGVLILFFALDWYYPYIVGLFLSDDSYIPEYLANLKSKDFANQFRIALSLPTVEVLRDRLDAKRQQQLADILIFWHRNLTHIFQSEGLLPISEVGSK